MTMQPQPQPKPAKSRLLQDGRDMFWSMAPLVAACILFAGMLGMCSVSTGGPGNGPALSFNAPAALRADAEALDIPIRVPALPEDWQPNSGGRNGIENGRVDPATGQPVRAVVSRVGYLAPSGMYLSLNQSNADEDKLVRSLNDDLTPTGVTDVDGQTWVIYEGADEDGNPAEPVWTTRLTGAGGPAQIALTGAAGTDEYRTLAAATQAASPLPTA